MVAVHAMFSAAHARRHIGIRASTPLLHVGICNALHAETLGPRQDAHVIDVDVNTMHGVLYLHSVCFLIAPA